MGWGARRDEACGDNMGHTTMTRGRAHDDDARQVHRSGPGARRWAWQWLGHDARQGGGGGLKARTRRRAVHDTMVGVANTQWRGWPATPKHSQDEERRDRGEIRKHFGKARERREGLHVCIFECQINMKYFQVDHEQRLMLMSIVPAYGVRRDKQLDGIHTGGTQTVLINREFQTGNMVVQSLIR